MGAVVRRQRSRQAPVDWCQKSSQNYSAEERTCHSSSIGPVEPDDAAIDPRVRVGAGLAIPCAPHSPRRVNASNRLPAARAYRRGGIIDTGPGTSIARLGSGLRPLDCGHEPAPRDSRGLPHVVEQARFGASCRALRQRAGEHEPLRRAEERRGSGARPMRHGGDEGGAHDASGRESLERPAECVPPPMTCSGSCVLSVSR
jgi:hypothetical protein